MLSLFLRFVRSARMFGKLYSELGTQGKLYSELASQGMLYSELRIQGTLYSELGSNEIDPLTDLQGPKDSMICMFFCSLFK